MGTCDGCNGTRTARILDLLNTLNAPTIRRINLTIHRFVSLFHISMLHEKGLDTMFEEQIEEGEKLSVFTFV